MCEEALIFKKWQFLYFKPMVMAGPPVHLNTFLLGMLEQAFYQYFVHILSLVIDKNPS